MDNRDEAAAYKEYCAEYEAALELFPNACVQCYGSGRADDSKYCPACIDHDVCPVCGEHGLLWVEAATLPRNPSASDRIWAGAHFKCPHCEWDERTHRPVLPMR